MNAKTVKMIRAGVKRTCAKKGVPFQEKFYQQAKDFYKTLPKNKRQDFEIA